MKYLIIGLGNPGNEYSDTRHNIGFKVLDAYAQASDTFFLRERYADIAKIKFKGRTLVLVKPNTYMNLSGKAVSYWLAKEKVEIENTLVIVDDIALPFGTIRIKKNGGAGGHNGLIDIIETLNTENFNRLRFGVGNNFSKGAQADYVLSPWSDQEQLLLPERINKVTQAVKNFATIGIERTMNFFNTKYDIEQELKKISKTDNNE